MTDSVSLSEKARALKRVALYRPVLTVAVIGISFVAALLEGIGLSFLLPIISLASEGKGAVDGNRYMELFVQVYDFLGIPLTLEYAVLGVTLVMTVRYTASFLVAWFRAVLDADYIRHLQDNAFENGLLAEISYFDEQGSDEILNAIVTQTRYAGRVIRKITTVVEQLLLSLMYVGIALVIAPVLTVSAAVVLGGITFLTRSVLESGYSVGDTLADANEGIQENVQAGMQGIRDVKLYGMIPELFEQFTAATDNLVNSRVRLLRNKAALNNFYQLMSAITVFVLIYAAIAVSSLSLAGLGVFLFAMFRLAPRISNLNDLVYSIEGDLPHLVRTQQFIDELAARNEPDKGSEEVPDSVFPMAFDDVTFQYGTGEMVFEGLSFSVSRGEFAAFVGPSGAGKSTIVGLLTRMYRPDGGAIRANGTPIREFDVTEWRSRVSVVQQSPHVFNDTLRRNVTIGDRNASQADVERVCEIAQVTEFLDDLPDGYDTVLGDDGVRLSGGQKQRVAIARALLKDADLLVLDEATSDLDSNIEESVHRAIESMEHDYAILVIAHRLSTVRNADCIYTIEDGEVVESGRHDELIANGGTYASLYETQTRAQ